jgi:2-polyprenyl-3-methyl-5-hydroxy-6-metoxy-1,4-benzoquinol methylase
MEDIYKDGTYHKKNPNWHQEESSWKARQVIEVIERNGLNPSSICDVGCGAGRVLRLLSEHLPGTIAYCGYDISPQAIALCSKMAKCNISFHCCDLLDEDKCFDLVLGLDVVEHVEDYIGFLRKLKGKARYKLLHIPLDLAVQRVLRINTMIIDMEHVGHLHFFTKETALAALKRAGYKIIESTYIAKRIDLRMGGKKARLLTIPRKLLFSINKDLAPRVFGGWSLSVLAE